MGKVLRPDGGAGGPDHPCGLRPDHGRHRFGDERRLGDQQSREQSEGRAEVLGVNTFLCAGALISAVAFGGHICLYSDTVILASASTQVSNAEYFRTATPIEDRKSVV